MNRRATKILDDFFKIGFTSREDRMTFLMKILFLTTFFSYLAYDITYVIIAPFKFLPAIVTITLFLVFTGILYIIYNPKNFELSKFIFLIAHFIIVTILVFYAVGKEPGIQYVYIAYGLAPIILYNRRYLFAWIVYSLVNFSLYIIADLTTISFQPADFVFPAILIVPFRISLIMLTVIAISSFIVIFYILSYRNEKELALKAEELLKLNDELNERNKLILVSREELKLANNKLSESFSILKDKQELLEEALATKDKFFSIIAHDIKNPLHAIIGFSKILKMHNKNLDIEKQKDYLEHIYEASFNLYALLENLLLWSRIHNGRLTCNPEKINLYHTIFQILKLVKLSCEEKGITIHNNIGPESQVFADFSMISTVLRNLISNAIKFTPENGNIYLEAGANKSLIKISVRDNGVGISKENQSNIFRIDKSSSTKGTAGESGTGLGLILSKEFIKLNKGEIGFSSIEGQGTTFWFTLPESENS